MLKRVTFDTDKMLGARVVLTNYLDGALNDFEEGWTDSCVIEDSINALLLLGDSIVGINVYSDYKEKFDAIKANREAEND